MDYENCVIPPTMNCFMLTDFDFDQWLYIFTYFKCSFPLYVDLRFIILCELYLVYQCNSVQMFVFTLYRFVVSIVLKDIHLKKFYLFFYPYRFRCTLITTSCCT